jgi:hypothetical protein
MIDYLPPVQAKSEKVTDTVGTLMKEKHLKVKTTKMAPEKVACTVGTFLNEGSARVKTTKTEPKGYLYGGNLF